MSTEISLSSASMLIPPPPQSLLESVAVIIPLQEKENLVHSSTLGKRKLDEASSPILNYLADTVVNLWKRVKMVDITVKNTNLRTAGHWDRNGVRVF